LLIGGGSGITPLMSMLRTLLDEGHKGQIDFLHYARTAENRLYVAELAEIARRHDNVKVVRALTRAAGGDLKGRIGRRHLLSVDKHYLEAETYVCGPVRLVDAAEAIWRAEGREDRLHGESFTPPPPKVWSQDVTGQIEFAASGVTVDNTGEPLLVQAERAGLRPRCGCRMGICHECVAHVDEGDVRDVQTGAVRSVTDEKIQICINAPVGDVKIDL
ncbi:MAG: iron-sulfur cluster-binding domain-containing protein, partial [Actinobacteria bacterium]|nr:iron-sulfur cluster-binding domain-containing protein [Actinomycetota bacterium]